jgi:hypothetical protein
MPRRAAEPQAKKSALVGVLGVYLLGQQGPVANQVANRPQLTKLPHRPAKLQPTSWELITSLEILAA